MYINRFKDLWFKERENYYYLWDSKWERMVLSCEMSIFLHRWTFEFKLLLQKRVIHDWCVFATKRINHGQFDSLLVWFVTLIIILVKFKCTWVKITALKFRIWAKYTGVWGKITPTKLAVFVTLKQWCISHLACSHPELVQDHVITSAYVIIFWTVATNAVNKRQSFSWNIPSFWAICTGVWG